jgi:hypothetical protein
MRTAETARGLVVFLASLLMCRATAARAADDNGYLRVPVRCQDGVTRWQPQLYQPQPGDLIFYSDDSLFWRGVFLLAWTAPPFHNGIVLRLPDGRLASLEAGAYDRANVLILELGPRFRSHDGVLWVRRLRTPLSAEKSRCLTSYGLEQTTKGYALVRMILEITPLRAHGPIGSRLFGSSRLDRRNWFCSELAVAAAAVAGIFDPKVMKPNTVYPRDLFIDHPHDISGLYEPPARWTATPNAP